MGMVLFMERIINKLTEDEKGLLVKISKSKEKALTESKAKNTLKKDPGSSIKKIEDLGLIKIFPPKKGQRSKRVVLSSEGEKIVSFIIEEQKVAKPKAKPKRLTVASLKSWVDLEFEEIRKRLDAIEFKIGLQQQGRSLKLLSLSDFTKELKRSYDAVCEREPRFSGVVPLSHLKRDLMARLGSIPGDEVDRMILQLEKDRVVDLQVAYDASSVTDSQYGINIPGRGLVFYLRWRD